MELNFGDLDFSEYSTTEYPTAGGVTTLPSGGYSPGFDTGFDILDKVMGVYFAVEDKKKENLFDIAALEQQHLANTVSVDQQINDARDERVAGYREGMSTQNMLLIGGAAVAAVALVIAVAR